MTTFNVPNSTSATYALNGFTTDTCSSTNALGTGVPMSPWMSYVYTPYQGYPFILPTTAFNVPGIAGVNLIASKLSNVSGFSAPVWALDSLRVVTLAYAAASATAATTLTITGFDDRRIPVTAVMPVSAVSSATNVETSFTATTSFQYLTSVVLGVAPTAGSLSIVISNAVFGSPFYINSKLLSVGSIVGGSSSTGAFIPGFNFYKNAPTSACPAIQNITIPAIGGDARGLLIASNSSFGGQLIPMTASLDCIRVTYYVQGADSFIQAQLNATSVGSTSLGQPIYPQTRQQYQAQIMQAAAPAVGVAWSGLNIYQPSASYLGGVNALSSFDIYGVQYPGDATDYNQLGEQTSGRGFLGNTFSAMIVPNA